MANAQSMEAVSTDSDNAQVKSASTVAKPEVVSEEPKSNCGSKQMASGCCSSKKSASKETASAKACCKSGDDKKSGCTDKAHHGNDESRKEKD